MCAGFVSIQTGSFASFVKGLSANSCEPVGTETLAFSQTVLI